MLHMHACTQERAGGGGGGGGDGKECSTRSQSLSRSRRILAHHHPTPLWMYRNKNFYEMNNPSRTVRDFTSKNVGIGRTDDYYPYKICQLRSVRRVGGGTWVRVGKRSKIFMLASLHSSHHIHIMYYKNTASFFSLQGMKNI